MRSALRRQGPARSPRAAGGGGGQGPPTQTSRQSGLGTCPGARTGMPWGCKDGDAGRCQTLQPPRWLGLGMGPGESESQGMEPGKGQEKGSAARWARALRGPARPQRLARNRAGRPDHQPPSSSTVGRLPSSIALRVGGSREHPPVVGLLLPPSPRSEPLGCHSPSLAYGDIPTPAPLPPALGGAGGRAGEGRAHWEPPETPSTFAFKH